MVVLTTKQGDQKIYISEKWVENFFEGMLNIFKILSEKSQLFLREGGRPNCIA